MSEWLKNNISILGFFFAVMSTLTTFLIYLINVQTERVASEYTKPIIEKVNKLETQFADVNARIDMMIKKTYNLKASPGSIIPKFEKIKPEDITK